MDYSTLSVDYSTLSVDYSTLSVDYSTLACVNIVSLLSVHTMHIHTCICTYTCIPTYVVCTVCVYTVEPSIPDTLGPERAVLIVEVSSLQGLKMYYGLI